MSIQPYYQDDWATIYHGDCRELINELSFNCDAVIVTDPPYPDYKRFGYVQTDILFLNKFSLRQFVFWSAKENFYLDFTAKHKWNKKIGCSRYLHYEYVYERNGLKNDLEFSYYLINSSVAAKYTGDIYVNHPSQKPIKLLENIISLDRSSCIVDFFMGSGTTIVAAKRLNRKSIGIEIEEKYCEIAANRLRQDVLDLTV